MLERKVDTGGMRSDYTEMHARDIRALARAKEMETEQSGCVTVRLERGVLTARPATIRHILTMRGYRQSEIEEIMQTAK